MADKSIKKLADTIIKVVDQRLNQKPKSYDTQAVVRRIDTKTGEAFVHIPNGIDETPVRLTIDAAVGDTVQVRVADGKAWLTGNRTAPPTDDTTARVAQGAAAKAEVRAEQAEETANAVSGIANSALSQAAAAKQIADDTEQHFWFTETGADTGAHITEVTQEEWNDVSDPNYHAGGNLLARSNGIAVRNGLTELASFGASESIMGNASGYNLRVKNDGVHFYQGSSERGMIRGGVDSGGNSYIEIYTDATWISISKNYIEVNSGAYGILEVTSTGVEVGDAITYPETTPLFVTGDITTAAGNITAAAGNITASGKLTAGAINNSLFEVTDVSFSISASSATAYEETSTSGQSGTTKTGYYPLGVVGFYITTGGAYSRGCYMSAASSGSCTIKMRIQATSTGSKSCTAKVLWVKTTA